MAKTTRSADADESMIDIALKKQAPARQFEGTDDQPIDADTGESIFEDINPRIRTWGPKEKAAKQPPVDEDDDLDEQIDEELDTDEDEEQEPAESDDTEEPSDEDEATEEPEEDEVPEEDEPPVRGKKDSKAFSKRLAREKRLREEAEANFADAMARINAVEKTQKLNASESEYKSAKADLESKIGDVRTRLEQAMENGSAKEQLALTEELTDLKSELHSSKAKFESAKAAVDAQKDAGPSPITARRVSAWLRKHPRYRTDAIFQDFVKSNDREIAKAGYSSETEEYYKELDRRIKERYPEEYGGRPGAKLKQKDSEREERKAPARSKHPSASFRRDNAAATKTTKGGFKMRGTKVQLTERQEQNMRNFGLDPKNPNDVREYVISNQ